MDPQLACVLSILLQPSYANVADVQARHQDSRDAAAKALESGDIEVPDSIDAVTPLYRATGGGVSVVGGPELKSELEAAVLALCALRSRRLAGKK